MSARTRAGAHLALGVMAVAAGALTTAWTLGALQEDTFPHDYHEGLFPLCTGCHGGIAEGDPDRYYPPPETCTRCHDDVDLFTVNWTGPKQTPDNVEFQHDLHADYLSDAEEPAQDCADCHVEPDAGRMAVQDEVRLETCFSCHIHQADDHQTDADCGWCHIPLAETSFSIERIAALPEPADHEGVDFLADGHGEIARGSTARCATCHTQERCTSCHVDGSPGPIARMPPAPETMELPPMAAEYPVPATHGDDGWFAEHGAQATLETCGTCHTSTSCRSCHVASVPAVVETLVTAESATAPGVILEARVPSSHESFFFMDVHGPLAAGDGTSCATCHEESFCVSCHEGPSDGGYHPAGFVARHASSAFGRTAECATCHSTQAFCRACHQEVGLTGFTRLGADYHAGGPIWLIRHGQAARQNLESCASCHQQTECMTCHSTVGAFKVSPHPADFDAERAFAKAPRTCAACHVRNPLIGRQP